MLLCLASQPVPWQSITKDNREADHEGRHPPHMPWCRLLGTGARGHQHSGSTNWTLTGEFYPTCYPVQKKMQLMIIFLRKICQNHLAFYFLGVEVSPKQYSGGSGTLQLLLPFFPSCYLLLFLVFFFLFINYLFKENASWLT